jgi:Ser/Thr protein kinase RdoA (MazF antagonist)
VYGELMAKKGKLPMADLTLSPREALAVLPAWTVGNEVSFPRPGSGTANASIVVRTETGDYFLKRRDPRYASLGQLAYDHSVMVTLAETGVPAPVAMLTDEGERWHARDGHAYELYFLTEGQPHDPGNLAQIEAAGELLGQMHVALMDVEPEGSKLCPRLFAPGPSHDGLLWALGRAREESRPDADETIAYLLDVVAEVARALPDNLYWSLPATIVHGDYHPGNLLFVGDEVAGVFDFDWVSHQPRMTDITDGLMFFAGVRALPVDVSDIRSVTQAFRFDWQRMGRFMRGYLRVSDLEPDELAALPDFIRARWLYARVDAMQRKLPDAEKLDFLLEGVLRPLQWVEQEAGKLRGRGWLVGG